MSQAPGPRSEIDSSVVSWAYDADSRLVTEQRSVTNAYNMTYRYDGAGNRLLKVDSGQQTGYSYNAANELTLLQPPSGSATAGTWDGNGNLPVENTGGALTTYTWDDENRLLGILFSNGHRETYSYAADGKRRKKVDVSGLQYLFVWDEENLLLWTDQTLAVQDQYTQYPRSWGGLISQRRPGASYSYGFDLQGSVRVMRQQSGSIGDKYTYKAFGEQIAQAGSNFNLYHFGGQWAIIRSRARRRTGTGIMCAPGTCGWTSPGGSVAIRSGWIQRPEPRTAT